MATIQLREVDGILMLPLSAEALSTLSLTAESRVQVEVEGQELVVRGEGAIPKRRRSRYKLAELLAEYGEMPRDPEEDRDWIAFPPVGRELL